MEKEQSSPLHSNAMEDTAMEDIKAKEDAEAKEDTKAKENVEEKVDTKGKEKQSASPSLLLYPCAEPEEDTYEDLKLEVESPAVYEVMQRFLPYKVRSTASREEKAEYMNSVLRKYLPDQGDKLKEEYREQILSNYQPLHVELYTLQPTDFFVHSFLKAINQNTEEGYRSIMSEPCPGVFTFDMLQPRFCEMMMAEVEHFENWIRETDLVVKRRRTTTTMSTCVNDFGLHQMLDKLMEDFICPISEVFLAEFGGSTLDSHDGFVEYGTDNDVDLGFHVDDADVILNVCLGKQFTGGDLFFRGVRCEEHVNTEAKPEEIFEYSHVVGRAILHCGRHRRGARATTSGQRINLLLLCRSSVFRDLSKYKTDLSGWCVMCKSEKEEKRRQAVSAVKMVLR
ncbi:PREDICTED: uncharacterized PKHD-type hydroxylase At1g22950-like [Nicotiana attenuata]|uniref:uncharacterized PKHD-type hydroxylase At1g22950-like n=1 Tax=Nicotiana attenuata TaxID=49451 RepID=UPI0009058E0A|nr:PREDICTED: uncharacterized PKHD-type hydroxylase At1g22950-like [Nicotiana attenuata]